MDWKRHTPTYYEWWERLRRSEVWRASVLAVARDAWTGTDRVCVIEIGRGKRTVTHWSSGGDPEHSTAVIERETPDIPSLSMNLEDDLQAADSCGLSCDLLIDAPWAVMKVFELSHAEAANVDRWIASHLSEVFPSEVADDIFLSQRIFVSDTLVHLVLGLARKSAVKEIRDGLAAVGCAIRKIRLGQLWCLDAALASDSSGPKFVVDDRGSHSTGCWLIRDGIPQAWAEVTTPAGKSVTEPEQLSHFRSLFGEMAPEPGIFRFSDYRPTLLSHTSGRWRIPDRDSVGGGIEDVIPGAKQRRGHQMERWAAWGFRWSALVTLVSLVAVVLGFVSARTADFVRGVNSEEHALLSGRLAALQEERARLLDMRSDQPATGTMQTTGIWYYLGTAKPKSIWLRQCQFRRTTNGTSWRVTGLSLDRESPARYARNLQQQSGFFSQLVGLERIDRATSRIPHPNQPPEVFHFELEISR